MAPLLRIDPTDPRPIWSQIEQGILARLAAGALAAGDPVPSVRELARELAINPATVARAYQALTEAGILTVQRGAGTFVAARLPPARAAAHAARLADGARQYATLGVGLGVTRSQAEQALAEAWRTLRRARPETHDA